MKIVTRKEAVKHGYPQYFTGNPCKRGHISPRGTKNCSCMECNREDYYTKHKTKKDQYYKDNREEKIAKQLKRQNGNSEYYQKQKQWRNDNKDAIALYRKDNADLYAFHAAKRRSQLLKAVPQWFERELVKDLFDKAYQMTLDTEETYHVDHIIPLTHPLVCGLHCMDNLQIITEEENLKKKNKFEIV